MIAILDYGLSNLLSVQRAVELFREDVKIVNTPEELLQAEKIVLPGVGAFEDGMNGLRKHGLDIALHQATQKGTPIMGICLGMQMLFEESDENGVHTGLGLIKGRVEKIPNQTVEGKKQCVPHIGWNHLYTEKEEKQWNQGILKGLEIGTETYFVHSYEGKPEKKEDLLAFTTYGGRKICAAVQHENVIGLQFHPEKSGKLGLKIIENFCNA